MEKSIRRRRSCSSTVLALVGTLVLSGRAPSAQSRKLSAPLPRLPGEVLGQWLTPDGERCVFLANPEIQPPSLFLVSLEQPDAPLEFGRSLGEITREGVRLSRDGTRLAFTASGDLYGFSLHGRGAPVLVAGVSVDGASIADRHHELSPDGSRAVCWARRGYGPFELQASALDGAGGPAVLSVSLSTSPIPPTFAITPDSARVVYTLDQDSAGVFELYTVPIDGSARPTKLAGVLASDRDVGAFRITADGTRVVYTSDVESNDVFELYIAPIDGSAASLKLSGPLVARGHVAVDFVLLPNERVLYRADATVDERFELFSAPLDASRPPVLLNAPLAANDDVVSFQATADGDRVVYVAREATDAARALHLAPTDGSAPPVLLGNPPISGSDVGAFRVSPDGAHAVHLSTRRGSTSELYSVPLAAGAAAIRLASSARHYSFEISSDGARVVYRTFEEWPLPPVLASVPIDGSLAPVELGPVSHFFEGVFTIAADSRSVFFCASAALLGAVELYRAPLDGSTAAERLSMPLLPGPVAGDATLVGIGAGGEHAVYEVGIRALRYFLPGEAWTVNLHGAPAPLRVFADEINEGMQTVLDPSGEFVVTHTFQAEGTQTELWSGAADGSRPSARLGKPGTHSWFSVETFDVSASGQYAFTTYDELFAGSLDGSVGPLSLTGRIGPRRVMGDVQLEPGGTRAVYTTFDFARAAFDLLSAPTDGSAAPVKLSATLGNGGVESYRISPRGGRVVYVADQDRNDVFELYSVPSDGSAAPVKLSGMLSNGVDVSTDFVLTPDGARVVYLVGGAFTGIFSVPIDGSAGPVDLGLPPVPGPETVFDLRITPDGRRAIFLADPEDDGTLDLFSTGITAGPARRLNAQLAPGGSVQKGYQLGPAGRRAVYRADQDSDEVFELYMVPTHGRRAPIKLNAPLSPHADVLEAFLISPDGTRAVFAADARVDDVVELFAVPLRGGVPPRLLHPPLGANADVVARAPASLAITPDSRHVLYTADADTDEVFELFESALPPTRRGAGPR